MAAIQVACGGLFAAARAGEGDADDLIVRALELRRKGNDQGALPLLQEAFKKSRSPRAAGQLGFCQQGLGQWAEAETHLTIAFDKASDPWVIKNHGVIAEALGIVRSHIARIEIIGEPAGAEVAINAIVVGKLPLAAPVHVSNGEIEVEVRMAGFASKAKSFHIDGGQYQRVVLRLERVPPVGVPMATVPATDPSAGSSALPPAEKNPPATAAPAAADTDSSSGPSGGRQALKWVAWGVGAVGVGVGIYGLMKNGNDVASFGKGCGLDANGNPHSDTPGTTEAQCISLKNSYESATVVAVVGFVGAAALTAAGFILWATEPPSSSDTGVASAFCAPNLGSRLEPGVNCVLRF